MLLALSKGPISCVYSHFGWIIYHYTWCHPPIKCYFHLLCSHMVFNMYVIHKASLVRSVQWPRVCCLCTCVNIELMRRAYVFVSKSLKKSILEKKTFITWQNPSSASHMLGSFGYYVYGLTLIPAWISKHIPRKVWDRITHPFPNFNGCTV